ncbi:hypothetical protein B0H12DRAFT_1116293 [Mycena haematopus]|nr:hypothetical protein B0H12DRAFT_1116293 [Mycena haematopus]
MSSDSETSLHKFWVYAPDKTDEGTYERRLSVRPKHLENAAKRRLDNAAKGIIDGRIREYSSIFCGLLIRYLGVGGAVFTPESITGGEKKMVGSCMIYEAESIEVVKSIVESDIYYTAGVWDPERLLILPFGAATHFP